VREGIEKRDALIAEGHATAARIVSEAEEAQRSQISALEQQRASLETRIEELRTFEREYRQKLKSYIEGQLHELDATEMASNNASAAVAPSGASFENVQTPPPASYQGFGGN
jgi:TolA-binding protein